MHCRITKDNPQLPPQLLLFLTAVPIPVLAPAPASPAVQPPVAQAVSSSSQQLPPVPIVMPIAAPGSARGGGSGEGAPHHRHDVSLSTPPTHPPPLARSPSAPIIRESEHCHHISRHREALHHFHHSSWSRCGNCITNWYGGNCCDDDETA